MFFYDIERNDGSFWPEARGGWRILYVERDDELVVVDEPPILRAEFHPCTLRFELEYALPPDIRQQTGDDDLHAFDDGDYTRIHDVLRGAPITESVIHQLGGPPAELQDGLFRQCQLASNGVGCGTSRVRASWSPAWGIGGSSCRSIPMKQAPGWMGGDCGRLYYCLHRDDLAARRFDRSW